MGRDTAGVRGIRLRGKDKVVSLVTVEGENANGGSSLLTVTQHGYGKMSPARPLSVAEPGRPGGLEHQVVKAKRHYGGDGRGARR